VAPAIAPGGEPVRPGTRSDVSTGVVTGGVKALEDAGGEGCLTVSGGRQGTLGVSVGSPDDSVGVNVASHTLTLPVSVLVEALVNEKIILELVTLRKDLEAEHENIGPATGSGTLAQSAGSPTGGDNGAEALEVEGSVKAESAGTSSHQQVEVSKDNVGQDLHHHLTNLGLTSGSATNSNSGPVAQIDRDVGDGNLGSRTSTEF